MPMVFTPCTGAVQLNRKECSANDFLIVRIDGTNFTDQFILQGVTLEMSGNYQFLHTVNDFVYFYAFGDRIGLLTLTGIGFLKTCDDAKEGAKIFQIYNYYNSKKSAAKGGKSLDVVLMPPAGGPIKLHGFLTGMKVDVTQSDTGPVGYWTLRLEVLPQKGVTGLLGFGGLFGFL
jgi:hypothetical protein